MLLTTLYKQINTHKTLYNLYANKLMVRMILKYGPGQRVQRNPESHRFSWPIKAVQKRNGEDRSEPAKTIELGRTGTFICG